MRKKGAETTLNFFYACTVQKIITREVYVKIIKKFFNTIDDYFKNEADVYFKNKAYYDLHKATLSLCPQECNASYLNKISPEFLFSQIKDPDELDDLIKIFESISDKKIRDRLKDEFFEICTIGSMIEFSKANDITKLSHNSAVSTTGKYLQGCEAMDKKKNNTLAKAHLVFVIEFGIKHPEFLCDTYYRLGLIHREAKQYVEAMGYFANALMLNTEKSEQIINLFLKGSLLQDDVLSICLMIVMVFSGKYIEDLDCSFFNTHISSLTYDDTSGFFYKSKRIPHKWILMITDNLDKALPFFNYCVSHKIIKLETYEQIILKLNINPNSDSDSDKIIMANYALFKASISADHQKFEEYLKKLPPLYLYNQLNNPSKFSDLQEFPLSFKYIILDELSKITAAFQDPNYCKVVSAFLDTISTSDLIPEKHLERHIRNLYMCIDNYDVLKLKESAIARLNKYLKEHPSKSKILSIMHTHNISDNDKMICAMNHIIRLLDNFIYFGEPLKIADNKTPNVIQQSLLHQSNTDKDNFMLLNEFYQSLCNEEIGISNPDIRHAFHESKRVLREVIKDVGCNIMLPPIEIQDIEKTISHMMLLLNILYRSKTQNLQKTDSLLAAAMTFFENNFNLNPEIPLIQSCLKETARIQAVIDSPTLTTEDILPFLMNFKKYIALQIRSSGLYFT